MRKPRPYKALRSSPHPLFPTREAQELRLRPLSRFRISSEKKEPPPWLSPLAASRSSTTVCRASYCFYKGAEPYYMRSTSLCASLTVTECMQEHVVCHTAWSILSKPSPSLILSWVSSQRAPMPFTAFSCLNHALKRQNDERRRTSVHGAAVELLCAAVALSSSPLERLSTIGSRSNGRKQTVPLRLVFLLKRP